MSALASLSAGELAGTRALIRLILRRDRVWLLFWVLVVVAAPIGIAASAMGLYNTAEAIQAYARESMNTPSAVAMLGRIYSQTIGGVVAWRSGLQSAILIAPVAIVLVIRHTRTEEEKGRRELLGATVVGRQAPLAAALAVVCGTSLVIGALIAMGLISLGLPAAGSFALSLSAASAGCVFAAVAGVAAQLTRAPGSARGIALLVFAFLYLVRAPGDLTGATWLTWLSPVGWLRQTRAFAGEQWWVFALFVGLVAVLVVVAYKLSASRDLGAGFLPERLGPAAAEPGLRSPLALAWRLQRGSLIGWTAVFLALGLLLGAVGPGLSAFVDVPELQDWVIRMGADNAGDAFLFTIVYILCQIASVYAIGAALEAQTEEADGRAEPVLATAVSRLRWLGSHLFFAFAGSTVILLVLGFAIGLMYGVGGGDVGSQLPRILARTAAIIPAVWVMAGIATALFGLLPRFAWFGSLAALAVFLFLELFWELQQISQAVFDISPFAHVHWARPVSAAAVAGLTLVAMVLTAGGLAGFRRRDVA